MREFAEELGLKIEVVGEPIVLESIVTHEGTTGHEVVFAADVRLPTNSVQGQDPIAFAEDDGSPCVARWLRFASLDTPQEPTLFPHGLKARLVARS